MAEYLDADILRRMKMLNFEEEEEEDDFPDCNDSDKPLPIENHKRTILKHIRDNRVTCLEAETGSGKSTKVPQYIVEFTHAAMRRDPAVAPPRVVITQPRRLAAKSLARRVARALGTSVGERVGYRIGQEHLCSEDTEILFVTAGYLIQYLVHNPRNIHDFTHIILDEVHERTLDSDLCSLIIKTLMKKTQAEDIKLIVMSATLQSRLFSRYFGELNESGSTKVLRVGTQSHYTVEELYLEDVVTRYHEDLPPSTVGSLIRIMADLSGKTVSDMLAADENMGNVAKVLQGLLKKGAIKPAMLKDGLRRSLGVVQMLDPAVDIIRIMAEECHTILVFLPGQGPIESLFDKLQQYEQHDCTGPNEPFPWKTRIRVFALYGKIPDDDQAACFQAPEPGWGHVILATNIAESSVTLPQVSVVLDFGKRKKPRCKQHRGKRLQLLEEEWCSRASMKQRRGRTGRVCDGVCIRFMPETIYSKCKDYDDPEILFAQLDKLLLQVKFAGESIVPGKSPSEWLEEAIQAPEKATFQQTIQCLADADALEEADEMSPMTLLGRAVMSLPLDVRLCRVVFHGVLLGVPCDAAVMAASLAAQDPFNMPMRKIIKDPERYRGSLGHSMNGRWRHDDGQYSEPLMALQMYKAWLRASSKPGCDLLKAKRKFCHDNAVMMKRLNALENTVAEVMETVARMLPRHQEAYQKVEELLPYLPRPQRYKSRRNQVPVPPDTQIELDRYFTRDCTMLKAVLVAALSPMLLLGKVPGSIPGRTPVRNPNPQRASIDKPEDARLAKPDALEALLRSLNANIEAVDPGRGNSAKVVIGGEVPDNDLGDVSRNMHEFLQLAEGRESISIPVPRELQGRAKMVELKAPKHASKLDWSLISAEGQMMRDVEEVEAQLEWRNPLGNACRLGGGWCLAVAHEYLASPKAAKGRGGPRRGGGREQEVLSRCQMSGVTLLPTEHDNLLAVVLVLAFLPRYLRRTVQYTCKREDKKVVRGVKLLGYDLPLSERNPLSTRLMRQILDVQAEVQEVMQYRQDDDDGDLAHNMDHVVVVDSDVPNLMEELFRLVRG